jgi:hypothetical protein
MVNISADDTMEKPCECGGELFRSAFRMKVLPSLSPKNVTGMDMLIKMETYICEKCGAELK